jgi:hypothetical protein
MRWKISTLDRSLRQQLVAVGEDGNLGGESCCFYRKRTLRALVMCALVGTLLTALGSLVVLILQNQMHVAMMSLALGLTGLAALWTLLLFVESIRVAGSRIKPFILVTPRVVLEAGGDHDYLTGYRLRDATDYQAVDNYSGANFRDRLFTFKFATGSWSMKLKDADTIRRLEQVLAQARSGAVAGDAGIHLLPSEPGLVRGTVRAFTNPFGEGWLGVGAVLLIGVVIAFFGSIVYSACVGRK